MKSVKIYPGADIYSDHNPVVMVFSLNTFLKVKREKVAGQIDIAQLKKEIKKDIETITNTIKREDVTGTWSALKLKITKIQEEDIGFTKNCKYRNA